MAWWLGVRHILWPSPLLTEIFGIFNTRILYAAQWGQSIFEAELNSLLFTNFTRYLLDIFFINITNSNILEMVLEIGKTGKFLIRFQKLFDSFVMLTHRQLILESFDFSLRQLSQISTFENSEIQIPIIFPIDKPQHPSLMKSLMKYKSRLDSSQNIQ